MAYLRKLDKPRCRCGKPATVELINARNASCGYYCGRCGAREHVALRKREDVAAASKAVLADRS